MLLHAGQLLMGILERGSTRYPQKTVDKAKALFAEGLSPNKIAAQLGISGDVVVRRWCDPEYRAAHNANMLRRRQEQCGSLRD
jgi:hypothetical protein